MAPIKSKTKRKSNIRGKTVQANVKNQRRNNASNDSEEDAHSTDPEVENYALKEGPNITPTPLYRHGGEEILQKKVEYVFSSEDEDIFDQKPEKQETDPLSNSMKDLGISNKRSESRKSQKDLKVILPRISDSSVDVKTKSEIFPLCRTRSESRALIKASCQTPSGRNLRNRNEPKKNTEYESPTRNTPVSKKKNKIKETDENICETPTKSGRILRDRGKSNKRNEITRESNSVIENNQSCELIEEDSRKSQKTSTRGRKSTAKVDTDCGYEGTPPKRKSAAKVVSGWQKKQSKSLNSAAARRKLSTVKKYIGTPKTPKSRTVTPKTRASTQRTRAVTCKTKVYTPRTPKGRRTLIPKMHTRSVNIAKPKSNLQEVRKRLHVSFVPKSLPCREEEFNNIFTFLRGKLTEEIGGCIYISGVPGTGKTATVNEVVSCLKKLELQGELPPFEFVDINGMKLTEPRQAYVQIKKKLTGIASSWEESLRYLHDRFTIPARDGIMTLLLIDEMDLLCTKRQDVVYNLLDWPTHRASHLIVITIANTMDLPERILMNRVTSRLGLTRLTFSPYNHVQLMEIVKIRLKDTEGFRPKAIELVARKIAAVTGDARRALDICRRATEIAESEGNEIVTIPDVTSALDEMIANPRVQAIKCCSLMEQKFLEAICQEVTRIGTEQVTLKNIYTQFEKLCLLEGEEPPNITQTLEICRKLASWRLVLWESGADIYQSVLLNVSADDIYFSRQKFD